MGYMLFLWYAIKTIVYHSFKTKKIIFEKHGGSKLFLSKPLFAKGTS